MSSFIEPMDISFDYTAPHTVVVLGPPRSGTSMIAGILRILGVYMGQCNESNNEDPRFNKRHSIESIRALITANNAAHPQQWGWKEPSTHIYFTEVADLVRTPFFVVSYRNIMASAASKLKHTDSGDVGKLTGSYASHYLRISKLLNNSPAPRLYVNFEKALQDPLGLAEHLSQRFFGVALDRDMHDKITRYCAPGAYKPISDFL